jgi:hypothetical protein
MVEWVVIIGNAVGETHDDKFRRTRDTGRVLIVWRENFSRHDYLYSSQHVNVIIHCLPLFDNFLYQGWKFPGSE